MTMMACRATSPTMNRMTSARRVEARLRARAAAFNPDELVENGMEIARSKTKEIHGSSHETTCYSAWDVKIVDTR
jgi:hypothetical protein